MVCSTATPMHHADPAAPPTCEVLLPLAQQLPVCLAGLVVCHIQANGVLAAAGDLVVRLQHQRRNTQGCRTRGRGTCIDGWCCPAWELTNSLPLHRSAQVQ